MQIDKTLILAAGKGTRMGEVGQKLPKVLWPIFEKSILELEVDYVKSLNNSKIYINSFHHKTKLAEYFKLNKLDLFATLLEETSEIDIGGAVHNLCEQTGYGGNLLIVNSDQFLMLTEAILDKALTKLKNYDGILFLTTVNSSEGYNQVVTNKENIFSGIIQNKHIASHQSIETYIGSSIIKLDNLRPTPGSSKFFDSVANPDYSKFYCINVDECTYWDFGTIKQYYENMFKILSINDPFKEFLINNKALLMDKIFKNSYNTKVSCAINLSDEENIKIDTNAILMAGAGTNTNGIQAIIYNETIQKLS